MSNEPEDRNDTLKGRKDGSRPSRRFALMGLSASLVSGTALLAGCGGDGAAAPGAQVGAATSSSSSSSSSTSSSSSSSGSSSASSSSSSSSTSVSSGSGHLPNISTALAAAYGVRKLVAAYAGAAVRVTVAGAGVDVGFSGDALNASGLSDGLYPVSTLYDQSGNGRHATAASANYPNLYIRSNYAPCLVFLESDYLQLPAALAVDRANSAVFHAARYAWQNKAVDCINWGTADTSSMRFGSFIDGGHTPGVQVIAAGATHYPSSTTLLTTCTPCLAAYNSSSSALLLRRDGYTQSVSAVSPSLLAGGRIGASGSGTSYGRQDMFSLVVYGASLSASDEAAVAAAVQSMHNLNSWQASKHIFMVGDSKTEGDAATHNLNLPRDLHDLYGNDPAIWIRNMGINGSEISTRYATFWFTYGAPYNFVEPNVAKNIVVCWLGINDIALGVSETDILADYNNFFTVPSGKGVALSTQGWNGTVLATVMPDRTLTSAQDTVRVALNAAIPSVGGVKAIWDVNALCNAGGPLVNYTTDQTLSLDGIHESEKAYALEAPSLKVAIEKSIS